MEVLDITEMLATAVKNHASDLHLCSGLPPMIRVHGQIVRLPGPALQHKDVHALMFDVMNDSQRKAYQQNMDCDFAFDLPRVSRFRVNALVERRGASAVFRAVPSEVPTLAKLGAPEIFKTFAAHTRGLVLVTGPTGSGKSTTLAALVDHRNETDAAHILTIEDPIEFVHESKKSLVRQRELGPHTLSFGNALRAALREDPDVILVGELRDLDTIKLALTAAETGHLVFGTLHTTSAAKSIDRIIDVFPAEDKETVRTMLSESLQAVISQSLLRNKAGDGRVAAHEIMVGTAAIRHLIREGKVAQMYAMMEAGQKDGMQTLDQCLLGLVKRGQVGSREARVYAVRKDQFAG